MSEAFHYRGGELHVESAPARRIAERFGTPLYVYSRAHLERQYRSLEAAFAGFPAEICYAVKANSNLAIVNLFARLGAGFDIVSGGELERVLHAGGDPSRVVFSGVGKRTAEIDFALKLGIRCFNLESAGELERLEARAGLLGCVAPISIRVNPDVDAETHPYIATGMRHNKFGVPQSHALALYRRAASSPQLVVSGIDCHIGSMIDRAEPVLDALSNLLRMLDRLAEEGIELDHVDIGGGLGVPYGEEDSPFPLQEYAAGIRQMLAGRSLGLILEPGRYLVANGGVLLTRVEYLKPADEGDSHDFAIVDAAMNDLLRPTLYQARHRIETASAPEAHAEHRRWDVVGPVCESADFLGLRRPLDLAPGALLAIHSAGAYGFVQSSNYNSRDRAAEVLVDGEALFLARRRESISDQLALERVPGNPALAESGDGHG